MTAPAAHPRFSLAPLGDSALLVESTEKCPAAAAEQIARLADKIERSRIAGVTDVVCSYRSLGVYFGFAGGGADRRSAAARVAAGVAFLLAEPDGPVVRAPRTVVIQVCYEERFAPDIALVASYSNCSTDEVINRHCQREYTVRAIGFSPGFPYLSGLSPRLLAPRRSTPRTRVPAGSVGIGGEQTGVYPQESPGGWNLIGRTPRRLFAPTADPPARLAVGDTVVFEPIDHAHFEEIASQERAKHEANTLTAETPGEPTFEVLRPGPQVTVQDLGRRGRQAIGVTPGGAMDPYALRLANLLVGNPESAAAIECVLAGPKLRALRDTVVAIAGAAIEGVEGAHHGRPIPLQRGDVLDLARLRSGTRAYLAIHGGVATPCALGGYGTDLRGRFGGIEGRALVAGDIVHTHTPADAAPRAGRWFATAASIAPPIPAGRVRLIRGPQADWFPQTAWRRLLTRPYRISPASDRMGMRLDGVMLTPRQDNEMTSQPVACGAIQVPPNGQPIILAADRQTIGGYPVIAVVATIDHARLAQMRPGDTVRFAEIGVEEAQSLLDEAERQFGLLRVGIAQHA